MSNVPRANTTQYIIKAIGSGGNSSDNASYGFNVV